MGIYNYYYLAPSEIERILFRKGQPFECNFRTGQATGIIRHNGSPEAALGRRWRIAPNRFAGHVSSR